MYLLDANAFMEANRHYYAFDLAPGFWTWLQDPALADQVASVEAIKQEITGGNAQLVDWARELRPEFWWQDDAGTVQAMGRLVRWATDSARHTTRPRSTSSSRPATSGSLLTPLLRGQPL